MAELLGRMPRFVDGGQLQVVIDHLSPLEQATLALEQVEHGRVRNKACSRSLETRKEGRTDEDGSLGYCPVVQ